MKEKTLTLFTIRSKNHTGSATEKLHEFRRDGSNTDRKGVFEHFMTDIGNNYGPRLQLCVKAPRNDGRQDRLWDRAPGHWREVPAGRRWPHHRGSLRDRRHQSLRQPDGSWFPWQPEAWRCCYHHRPQSQTGPAWGRHGHLRTAGIVED